MTEQEVRAFFLLAGINVVRIHELMNGYWGENKTRGPWWLVETKFGLIRIGWRKRVVSLEWESTPLRAIVTNDDTTKEETLVHAWSYLKVLEYLTTLGNKLERASVAVQETAHETGESP